MTDHTDKYRRWLTPFRRILELEKANGWQNKAVVGGLDCFLRQWAGELAAFLEDARANGGLARPVYAALTPEQRQEWAARWRPLLEGRSPPEPAPADERQNWAEPSHAPPEGCPAPAAAAAPPPPAEARQKAADQPARPGSPGSGAGSRAPAAGLSADKDLEAPVKTLRRVSDKQSAQLARLGVNTIRDLLYFFPRRHIDYSRKVKVAELTYGQEATVQGRLQHVAETRRGRPGQKATEALLSDETGSVQVTWFNQPYLSRTLKPGIALAVSGRVEAYGGRRVFESPEYEIISRNRAAIHTGRMLPVYPLTAGLWARTLRGLTWQALRDYLPQVDETLPPAARQRADLCPLPEAIRQAHYPDSEAHWAAARRRLAFEELLTLQLVVLTWRQRANAGVSGIAITGDAGLTDRLIASLPFSLTGAQLRCIREILADMRRGTPPMNRLLQGEVGSGKTVVALAALLSAIGAGRQGAIMAPTEVLAEQHFQTVTRLLDGMAFTHQSDNLLTASVGSLGRPITVGLLTGSTRARPRRKISGMASEASLNLLIGTNALIQEGVELPNLALAVIDEQHRFGVMQRSALRQKSSGNPHTLVMSATPIPRTLTLTLYGDLDLSSLDELPPGRPETRTRWAEPDRREAVYEFIRRQALDGRQAFIVYPLIDESEAIDTKAAVDGHRRLSGEVFPDLRLGLLHGRMSAAEKDRTLSRFRDGELDILITTAVVEVGIDVPNATVMLIEGADRFGLSQLHQFRGRVGRGQHKSYCILMSDDPSETAKERLAALESTSDGFQLAEADLALRGPGEFFGTRQSGLPSLKMAQLADRQLLELARNEARLILDDDPGLSRPEYQPLAAQLARFRARGSAAGAEIS